MRSTGRFIIVHFVHVIMMCFKRHWSGFFLGIDSSGAGLMESLWLKKKRIKNVSRFLFTYFNFPCFSRFSSERLIMIQGRWKTHTAKYMNIHQDTSRRLEVTVNWAFNTNVNSLIYKSLNVLFC